jgi:hypothetical protein
MPNSYDQRPGFCEHGPVLPATIADPALVWVGGSQGRLYMIGRNPVTGKPNYTSSANVQGAGCAWNPQRWTPCATFAPFQDVFNAQTSIFAPAAVELPNGQILLVYPAGGANLWWQTGTADLNTGDIAWDTPHVVPSSVVAGPPALIREGNQIALYAALPSGPFARWGFKISNSTWSQPTVQVDEASQVPINLVFWDPDAGNINPGIGVTAGYLADSTNSSVFAIVPSASWGLSLWQRVTANNWQFLLRLDDAGGQSYVASGQPAIAYTDSGLEWSNQADGRFYFAFPHARFRGISVIAFTEGNDANAAATDRRLRIEHPLWQGPSTGGEPVFAINEWNKAQGRISLVKADWDLNLRMAYSRGLESDPITMFMPLADGAVHHDLGDHDDYYDLQNALACTLWGCCDPQTGGKGPTCPGWL